MTQKRAIATRSGIIRAAATVFEEHGFAGATIAQILETANVTKGALYFHFKSKEDLAKAIVGEQSNWVGEQSNWVEAHVAEKECPLQDAVDVSYRFVVALQKDPLVRASIRLTLEQNTFGGADSEPYRVWLNATHQMMADAQALGQLRAGLTPEAAANAVIAAVTGSQLTSEAVSGRKDLPERMHDLWVVLLPGLLTENTLPLVDPWGSRRLRAEIGEKCAPASAQSPDNALPDPGTRPFV